MTEQEGAVTGPATALPYGVEHLMSKVIPSDQIRYPPDVAKDDLRWGFRLNRPDFISSHGYRWPFPGNWAVASGPILDHDGDCCRKGGDGICAAHTLAGASFTGACVGTTVGLLVAWTDADVLGCSADKVRLRRAWVAAVFDPATSLQGANLQGAHLQRSNLRDAHLRGAYLQGANLRGANLQDAHLQDAHLQDANLRGANLQGANLQDAHLRGANLQDAHLQDAHLQRSNLQRSDLRGADLQDADLQDAYLQRSDLQDADLQDADLQDANLQDADLQSADLQGANLRGANLRGADLRGANLQRSDLQDAPYSSLTAWPAGFDPAAAGAVKL